MKSNLAGLNEMNETAFPHTVIRAPRREKGVASVSRKKKTTGYIT